MFEFQQFVFYATKLGEIFQTAKRCRYFILNALLFYMIFICGFKVLLKSPKLSKMESLAIYTTEGGVPEYYNQQNISQTQADDFMKSVLNTIVEKDIFQRLNINNKHDFNKIAV